MLLKYLNVAYINTAVQERWYPVPFGANLRHYKSLFGWLMDVAKSNTPFLFVALMTGLYMMQTIIPAEVVKGSFFHHFRKVSLWVVQTNFAVAQFDTD